MGTNPSLFCIYGIKGCPPEDREKAGEESLSQTQNILSWGMSLDFIAGCVGGCAGVLVGHPLDTIKVHLQTQDPRNPKYNGIWHCMKTIVAENKIRGLYRGMTSPMAGIGAVNAIVFGIYGNVERRMEHPDSLYTHFIAGSLAGLVQSVICAPMELAKTRIQLQHDSGSGPKFRGPFDCLKHIMRTEGLRGTMKGLSITAARDVPGFASYFVSYEMMMRFPREPNALHSLWAGGFAGCFSWLACYPMDVIKTCLQADGNAANPKYTGVLDCARKGYASDGIHFFSRGLVSTLIRAFPMNAACFFVVSLIMRFTKTTDIDLVVQSAEPLAIVGSIGNAPLCHIHNPHSEREEMERRRFVMARSMRVFGAFNEAVCHSEVEELTHEFYPDNKSDDDSDNPHRYYIFEDERLLAVESEPRSFHSEQQPIPNKMPSASKDETTVGL